ncbi:MAG: L-2-amino-thiazoline-4-carboxylic acid hydrolase [Candidatus Schekmanbacteria bacterium]|nr:L-2-amino-thiazoline-4-carboxylic acid hydrolase [Candidatus Schekmanbacteria bacterium]
MQENINTLKAAIKERAVFYLHMYRTLQQELGAERAKDLMWKAIYRWGREKAAKCPETARTNPEIMAEEFVKSGAKALMAFGNEIVESTKDGATLRLNSCPLVEAWREAGLNAAQIAQMCDMAYALDFGKYEGLGYELEFPCRIADGESYCQLNLKLKK